MVSTYAILAYPLLHTLLTLISRKFDWLMIIVKKYQSRIFLWISALFLISAIEANKSQRFRNADFQMEYPVSWKAITRANAGRNFWIDFQTLDQACVFSIRAQPTIEKNGDLGKIFESFIASQPASGKITQPPAGIRNEAAKNWGATEAYLAEMDYPGLKVFFYFFARDLPKARYAYLVEVGIRAEGLGEGKCEDQVIQMRDSIRFLR